MYVPFVLLPTAPWSVALLDPDGVTELRLRLQMTPGAPQASSTVPAKLFSGATVMVIRVSKPAFTDIVVGAEIEKSMTGCVTAADLLEAKFVSPA